LSTPYVTPDILQNAPTGIDWSSIPNLGATEEAQFAELTNLCNRATAVADGYCNLPLRATINAETKMVPDYRLTINYNTGVATMIMDRFPVLQILYARWSPASPPLQWQDIPTDAVVIEDPLDTVISSVPGASGGSPSPFISIASGYITWSFGRRGCRLQLVYVNGFPHCGLTAEVAAGSQTLEVDDVTGWVGVTGRLFDGGYTETVNVTGVTANSNAVLPGNGGTAPAGPGQLQLSSPLLYAHGAGLMVSSLPDSVMQACIYYSVADALTRGGTAFTVPGVGASGGAAQDADALIIRAEELLQPFRRII